MVHQRCLLVVLLPVLRSAVAKPSDFLAPEQDPLDQTALFDHFEDALGSALRQPIGAHVGDIMEALSHTFATLPKNAQGAIGAAGARYAIHRLFVQRHGWYIEGMAVQGSVWSSSPAEPALGNASGGSFHGLWHSRFDSRGLNLHELAILASTLESMVHLEAVRRVRATYEAMGIGPEVQLDEDQVNVVMDSYMLAYIMGYNISSMNAADLEKMRRQYAQGKGTWPEIRDFLRQVQRELSFAPSWPAPADASPVFSFDDVARIAETVGDRFGQQKDGLDCEEKYRQLLLLEEAGGTGRVKLWDFYASVEKHGFWEFTDNPNYLREAGVLDDSDPSTPRVIIPNYLSLRTNCWCPSSAFYELCCIDRCEELMDHVEREIREPYATPASIIAVVSALASASVPANRMLPAELVRRLHEVSEQHGGVVPLHGRLFAQWMHFAYPRECQYPHVANASRVTSPEAFEEATRQPSRLMAKDAKLVAERMPRPANFSDGWQASGDDEEPEMCTAMWQAEEELVDPTMWNITRAARAEREPSTWTKAAVRGVALLAVVLSTGHLLWQAKAALSGEEQGTPLAAKAMASYV